AKLSDEKAAREATLAKLKALHAEAGDNRSLAYVYGRELHLAGQNTESLAVLRKAAEGDMTSEVAEELTSIYQSQNDVANLLDLLGKSVGKTASLATLGDAGAALAKDKELVAKLIAAARETRKSQPDKLTSGTALAVALLAMQIQDFDAADEFYALVVEQPEKVARTKSPKAEAILAWGLEMLQAEQPERAARVFQRAIDKKLLPEREELLYYFLSGALEMQDKTTEALAALDAGMAKGKPSLRLLSRRAWIQYHAERYADAEKSYLELLAKYNVDHKSADVRDSLRESRLVLSNICVQTKRVDEGIEWLEQVLDEFPEDVGAHNDLGYLFAEQGKHLLRALRMTQFAVAAEPENSAYRDSLGWAYYQLGRYPEAVVELEKALSLREPDGVILDHLADAYAKNQQRDKALATYELAVAAFQKDKDQDEELLKKTQAKLAALRKS
ncbi:MAG TPA: tetratricopeptide repeat protein, partial [Pirellulaceae bacterium]|nr:tetratricopeptide repeat protein [Pirellulaceae bacterium]